MSVTISEISDSVSSIDFDRLATHPLQSWNWGEARKKMGIKVVRIGEYENNKLIRTFQITLHSIPHTKYFIGYLPKSTMPSIEVIKYLRDFGKRNHVVFIKIEPNILKNEANESIFTQLSQNTGTAIIKSPHALFPDWTMQLDISADELTLLKNMRGKTRYNIGLSERKGVTVKEESNDQGFKTFIALYFDTCRRQHYYGHSIDYHKTIWDNLKANMSHILTAYYNDIPLASFELFVFNNVLYYPYGGTSIQLRNLMGANLLMWESIRFGKRLGATLFDMWGSLPPDYDNDHPWSGFTRFKEGYGASFVQMVGSYDMIIEPSFYKIYNLMHIGRSLFLKVRHRFQ